MDLEKLEKNLRKKGYEVCILEKKEDMKEYLKDRFHNTTIGFGDSITIKKTGFYESVMEDNVLFDPNRSETYDEFLEIARKAMNAEYFFTGVNAMTENGEIVNLDGTGNRIAGSLFGHKKVYYVLGTNKIVKDLDEAIFRTRNIAAPKNARRLGLSTPCAVNADKCYDCSSMDRICNGLLINYRKMDEIEAEVIIIREELGL